MASRDVIWPSIVWPGIAWCDIVFKLPSFLRKGCLFYTDPNIPTDPTLLQISGIDQCFIKSRFQKCPSGYQIRYERFSNGTENNQFSGYGDYPPAGYFKSTGDYQSFKDENGNPVYATLFIFCCKTDNEIVNEIEIPQLDVRFVHKIIKKCYDKLQKIL